MKESTTIKINSQAASAYKVRRPIAANLVYIAVMLTVGALKKIV